MKSANLSSQKSKNWSITGRLALFFGVSSFALLSLTTGFLYWVLRQSLNETDAQFLTNKIHVLRVILRERPDDPKALEEEVVWEGQGLQFTRYYARVLDPEKQLVIETPGMGDVLEPWVFDRALDASGGIVRCTKVKGRDGKPYAILTGYAPAHGQNGNAYTLQVALDDSYEEAILSRYGRTLVAVLIVGLFMSAFGGVVWARRGMRPLREIAAAARRITSSRLNERIGQVPWPNELKDLAESFDGMLQRLEASFGRLSRFSADLAHELRTPINNMMGEAEVALTGKRSNEEYQHVLASILEENRRLARIVRSLLFLARADNEELELKKEQVELRSEVEKVCEFFAPIVDEKGIYLSVKGEAHAAVDPDLFRRVISNLLANAVEYTPSAGSVQIELSTVDEVVEIVVQDTGCGMAPDEVERVFEPFFRGRTARENHIEGNGLGLAIVQSIVELHGGHVAISSHVGRGTTVRIRLPF